MLVKPVAEFLAQEVLEGTHQNEAVTHVFSSADLGARPWTQSA